MPPAADDAGLSEGVLRQIDAELDAQFARAGDDPIILEIRRIRREEMIAAAKRGDDA